MSGVAERYRFNRKRVHADATLAGTIGRTHVYSMYFAEPIVRHAFTAGWRCSGF